MSEREIEQIGLAIDDYVSPATSIADLENLARAVYEIITTAPDHEQAVRALDRWLRNNPQVVLDDDDLDNLIHDALRAWVGENKETGAQEQVRKIIDGVVDENYSLASEGLREALVELVAQKAAEQAQDLVDCER